MFRFIPLDNPIHAVLQGLIMPFRALFVVGICFVVNWMTSPGVWWVKWVAFGMGIAVLVAWARAIKAGLLLGILALIGWWAYRKYGDAGKDKLERWLQRNGVGAGSR